MNKIEKLNIDDLYRQQKKTNEHKIGVYNKILERVHSKIKYTSRLRNSDNFTFFIIPEFILGLPRFDTASCTAYIIEKLKENGFITKYTYPNLLFVSWSHYIPLHERNEYKKRTGITIDGFGKVIRRKHDNNNNNNNNLDYSSNPNGLMFKSLKKDVEVAAKPKKDYNDISNYKPTGMIYSSELIKTIRDKVN